MGTAAYVAQYINCGSYKKMKKRYLSTQKYDFGQGNKLCFDTELFSTDDVVSRGSRTARETRTGVLVIQSGRI